MLTITSDDQLLNDYTYHDIPKEETLVLPNKNTSRSVKVIEPVRAVKGNKENIIPDEYYLRRHRKNEINEKKVKNREKEKLKHGYYQQKLLVDRIKAMDKSILQSIVSSIRHRTDQKEQDDIDEIHQQLLDESMDILRRYESLGFHSPDHSTTITTTDIEHQEDVEPPVETAFQKSLKTIPPKKRITPTKVVEKQPRVGTRRSTRTTTAFGQKLPSFENQEFELPSTILDFKKD